MRELHIIPCIHSLLYAPVYLAILCMARRGHAIYQEKHNTWTITDIPSRVVSYEISPEISPQTKLSLDLKISLHKAAGGDRDTVDTLGRLKASNQTQSGGTPIYLGVCDPRAIYEANKQIKDGCEYDWPKYQILGVFIDRIILSILCRKPWKLKTLKTETLEKRDLILDEIINKIKMDSPNAPGTFSDEDPSHDIRYAYWWRGLTTEYIVKRYLQVSDYNLSASLSRLGSITGASRRKNKSSRQGQNSPHPDPHPDAYILSLSKGEIDIAITHAPWEVNKKYSTTFHSFCRECFPSVCFPYSCIASTVIDHNDHNDIEEFSIRKWFMRELQLAISLIQRDPLRAVTLLTRSRKQFFNYGLRFTAEPECRGHVERAINYFLRNGGFSDQLFPSLAAWSMALNLGEINQPNALSEDQCDVLMRSIDQDFRQALEDDDRAFHRIWYGPRLRELMDVDVPLTIK